MGWAAWGLAALALALSSGAGSTLWERLEPWFQARPSLLVLVVFLVGALGVLLGWGAEALRERLRSRRGPGREE